jgi:hypothetical protein
MPKRSQGSQRSKSLPSGPSASFLPTTLAEEKISADVLITFSLTFAHLPGKYFAQILPYYTKRCAQLEKYAKNAKIIFVFYKKIEKNSLTIILLYVILILGYLAEHRLPF